MKTTLCAAALILAAALAGCTTSNTIDGHEIKGTVKPAVIQTEDPHGLHARAPHWFKDYWAKYLRDAQSYAIMAVDRRARGAFYVYCQSPCAGISNVAFRAHKEVNFKYEALKQCAEQVRREFPAAKPDCAIYAIKDKIVWKGPMPWVR